MSLAAYYGNAVLTSFPAMHRLVPCMVACILSCCCFGQKGSSLFMDRIATDTVRISTKRIQDPASYIGCNWSTFVIWQQNDTTHLFAFIEPGCSDGIRYERIISKKELRDLVKVERRCRKTKGPYSTTYDRFTWTCAGESLTLHCSASYRERLYEMAMKPDTTTK